MSSGKIRHERRVDEGQRRIQLYVATKIDQRLQPKADIEPLGILLKSALDESGVTLPGGTIRLCIRYANSLNGMYIPGRSS